MPADDVHSRRVLIVERDGTGHRLYLVRLLAEQAISSGSSVTVLLSDAQRVDRYIAPHLGALGTAIDLRRLPDASWSDVVALACEVGADLTVVPDADQSLVPLLRARGWHGPGRLSLLVMRPTVTRTGGHLRHLVVRLAKLVAMLAVLALPRVRMRVLRSGLDRKRLSVWKPAYDPVSPPAPAEAASALKQRWGLDQDRFWFGILGAITANKNLPMVAEALRGVADAGLLVAGGIEPAVREQLDSILEPLEASGVRVVLHDEVVSDEDFDAAMRAIDALVLAYMHNGPSGTLAKALAAGTRVVSAGSPALRRDAEVSGGAVTWCPLEPEALRAAMTDAVSHGRIPARMIATEREFTGSLLDGE